MIRVAVAGVGVCVASKLRVWKRPTRECLERAPVLLVVLKPLDVHVGVVVDAAVLVSPMPLRRDKLGLASSMRGLNGAALPDALPAMPALCEASCSCSRWAPE